MLHVNVPPELEQYGVVGDIAGRVYLTGSRVVATVPWLGWADVVQNLRVFTIPTQTVHQLNSTCLYRTNLVRGI